ncbi:unnamed protein product [Cylindrotheca closterium]|uniref:Uncharacterized protein n=1 Tax=Cylindrotheca closterium TaxID=2856 RepID=A0AAD2CGB0_9STRA|nr:unnamed protein product [Cylindrotheca closterium]
MAADAIPKPYSATPILLLSSLCMAILKPWPSLSRRISPEIRTFSMIKFAVDETRIPNLSSLLTPKLKPSASLGTMNADIPFYMFHANLILGDDDEATSWKKTGNLFETLVSGGEDTCHAGFVGNCNPSLCSIDNPAVSISSASHRCGTSIATVGRL